MWMIIRRTRESMSNGLGKDRIQPDMSHAILSLRTRAADYSLACGRLALLCAWNGRQDVCTEGRRVCVDDDTWLAMRGGSADVRIRGLQEVHALTILFRRGMPEEVLGTLITDEDRLLESGEPPSASVLPFLSHLHAHDRNVTPVLLFIRRHCDMGLEDPLWYEEQFGFLLERMLAHHRGVVVRARNVPARRASTRREILRRVSLSTDFIHSCYDRPLTLGDMAKSAYLSRHHFLRLFKSINEVTPHEYLQRKRTSVAARLLRNSEMAVEQIVKQVGFDSRSTLFRALRRFHGLTPRQCRRMPHALSFMDREAAVPSP
jgi:AraC family transcriptional regulator